MATDPRALDVAASIIALCVVATAPASIAAQRPLEPLSELERIAVGEGPALELTHVLVSVDRHHPAVEIAEARVRATSGARLSAEGAFDPTLSASAHAAPLGYYSYARADVSLTQATPLWGTSFVAGWRIGRGSGAGIPDYYGNYETLDGGELRVGATVPLWRDGPIDSRRAGIARTERAEDAAMLDRDARVLRVQLAGAEAYYRWAAAGLRLAVAQSLLDIADERDAQIAGRVAAGAIAAFEHLENRRAVLERRQAVIAARRAIERTAIQLSLFVRGSDGAPRVASVREVPDAIAIPTSRAQAEDVLVERALTARPELARYLQLREAARVSIELAENQIAPRIDLSVLGTFDVGGGASGPMQQSQLGMPVLETWLLFSLPLGMREARGRADAARADLDAITAEQELAADQVRIEVRDALSAVRAALDALEIAEQSATVAEAVARGERARFDEGATSLLIVNLREIAAAQARATLIDAQAELAYSLARLRVVTGESPAP
ncbi:MAG: TolC family protein [Myxococcota bacterium]|nr:TolC family protein [Myxococcota bacterium]